jgi:hypothetical protein
MERPPIIQEFSMITVTRPIPVRCSRNKRDSQPDLVEIFIGLTLNDWMTNSILGILCPASALEEARMM